MSRHCDFCSTEIDVTTLDVCESCKCKLDERTKRPQVTKGVPLLKVAKFKEQNKVIVYIDGNPYHVFENCGRIVAEGFEEEGLQWALARTQKVIEEIEDRL